MGLADLWLDQQTAFGRIATPAAAWSRAEWVEQTFDVWRSLTSPVASSFSAAITGLLTKQSEELGGLQPMLEPQMREESTAMLPAQRGQALGQLANAAVRASHTSFPLTKKSSRLCKHS